MKNILLPTDFSDNSVNAIKYALQLFEKTECTFYFLHTFTPAAYNSGKALKNFTSVELVRAEREAAAEKMRTMIGNIGNEFSNPRHSYEWTVDFNLLISKIKSMVKEKQIDMILMGTQGATGALEVFLGTHTMYTIKKVDLPVLAVPSGYKFKKPEQILFATDYKIVRTTDLEMIKFFTELHQAKLHVMNVYTSDKLEEEQKKNRELILEFFKDQKIVFHLTEAKDVPDAVEKFQKAYQIDLVFMVHKKRSFFENILFKPVVSDLVYHTNIPFLVSPVKA
ncbi:universal stress protein [Christiangramia sabulilitoris]|uniref:Universal stress protein n=1 Tax=Christiangramia sabulilitoris TaxID=2583991 RepID=A0A550I7M3_9FLAO|nr:universal stress protein [Christiangramia sabulilitoris]TRO66973.1 universal stress protein [Christiangramia sabulilitoris]